MMKTAPERGKLQLNVNIQTTTFTKPGLCQRGGKEKAWRKICIKLV
jgi:hypothetical protein